MYEDLAEHFVPVDVDDRTLVLREVAEREGQAAFRLRLLRAYDSQCAITGEHTVPVLDAAHIQPYMGPRSNHVHNGLLFDKRVPWRFSNAGYVGVTPGLRSERSAKSCGAELGRIGVRYLFPTDRSRVWRLTKGIPNSGTSRDALGVGIYRERFSNGV